MAGTDGADSVAHGYSIDASSAALGTVVDGEEDSFALLERDDFGAGLHAGALFGEDEFATGEVCSGSAEEEGGLNGKNEVSVEVLM